METVNLAPLTVRELIAELSDVEDDLRRARRPAPKPDSAPAEELDLASLVHREQLLAHELRRRGRLAHRRSRPARHRKLL